MREARRNVQDEIRTFPLPVDDAPQARLVHLCYSFVADISKQLDGSDESQGLYPDVENIFVDMQNALTETHLRFDVLDETETPMPEGQQDEDTRPGIILFATP